MAYDEILADRIRDYLTSQKVRYTEKNMFGGCAFMVKDKLCVGVLGHDLMVRFDPSTEDRILDRAGARPMDFTGRPMKGYVFVDPLGTGTTAGLKSWITLALEYNPKARSRKKRASRPKGRTR